VKFTTVALASAAAYAAARIAAAMRHERAVAARLKPNADGIVPGAAPIDLPGDGPHAVLLLHGFGDTPQTVGYLATHLNARGWTVRAPLLPGHGRTLRAFRASRAEEWLAAARAELAAMRARHGRVSIAGLSMGGAIATVLAAEVGDVPALALIAPYLSMPRRVQRIARLHPLVWAATPYVRGGGERSIHDPAEQPKNLAYGLTTPRLLFELLRMVQMARTAAPRVAAPTLVIQSREDHRIPPEACQQTFGLLGAREKRLLWVEGCGHLITVDYERERVFSAVTEWLGAHAPPAPRRVERPARRSALRETPV
jgi:carboxylesterase